MVFEHPLLERLAHHRPDVLDPELLGYDGTVRIRGDRGDPVHHAVRKRHVLRDPGAKLRVPELCKGGEHLPGHISDAEVDDPGGQPGAVVARCGQGGVGRGCCGAVEGPHAVSPPGPLTARATGRVPRSGADLRLAGSR